MNHQKISRVERFGHSLMVTKLFDSIQGEGPLCGLPCTFLRLQGCVLRCQYCDTSYDVGKVEHVGDLVEEIMRRKNRLLILTGGEPLRQRSAILLVSELLDHGWKVQVETSGSVMPEEWLEVLPRTMVVCSPKTRVVVKELVPLVHSWKYVVEAGKVCDEDGLPNRCPQSDRPLLVQRPPAEIPPEEIFVGPCWSDDEDVYRQNVQAALHGVQKFGYRLNLQVHKWLGVE